MSLLARASRELRRFILAAFVSGLQAAQADVIGHKSIFAVGNRAWQTKIQLFELDAQELGVAAGRDGSVYMAGYTQLGAGSWDAFVAKYSWTGQLAWHQLHGTIRVDDATSVASGSDGSVLLAGFTEGDLAGQTNHGAQDAFVTLYSPNGTHTWTRLMGTGNREEARSVVVGADGSVIVAGFSEGGLGSDALAKGGAGGKDVFVSKLSERGNVMWTQALGTASHDIADRVALQDDGSVIVAGYSFGQLNVSAGTRGDVFVARFSPEGRLAWVRQDVTIGAGNGETHSRLTSLACGGDGSISLAGFTMASTFNGQTNKGGIDSFVVKYSSSGDFQWAKLLGTELDDKAWSVASTSDGGVLLAGASQGNLEGRRNRGGWDAFVVRYSPAGTLLWADLIGTEYDDEAKAIVMALSSGGDEHFLVAGYTHGSLVDNFGLEGDSCNLLACTKDKKTTAWSHSLRPASAVVLATVFWIAEILEM